MNNNAALLELVRMGDKAAEAQLVADNMPLVRSIARRFENRGVDSEDLLQIGSIGLIKAIRNFDASYNVCFSTYAVPMVLGEIRRFLRDDGMIKVSRSVRETAYRGAKARERLQRVFGREPLMSEIAKECGISAEELSYAFCAAEQPGSMDAELCGEGKTAHELVGGGSVEETVVSRVMLKNAMKGLKEKEKRVIICRYFKGMTQKEAAEIIGVSQVQISRIEKKAVEKIREFGAK